MKEESMHSDKSISVQLPFAITIVITIIGLYFSSLHSYILFHSLIEIATISVGFTLFILTWNVRNYLTNNYLRILGTGYAFIAMIDLIHTLAYKGMNVFPDYGSNLPTQLWIAARYLQAITLGAAPFFIERRMNHHAIIVGYAAVVPGILLIVFFGIFPDCFIEGKGLTPFKIISEYVITIILLTSLIPLYSKRELFYKRVFILIVSSIVCTAFSEISFTAYISVYGFANLLGHFFKLAAFYLIYHAVLVTGFKEPFNLIFRDLKKAEEGLQKAHDNLEDQIMERTAHLDLANKMLAEEITERKRTEQILNRLNRELHAISNCNQILMRAENEQSLLSDICRIICDEAGYRFAWVGYAENNDARNVRPAAWAGIEDGYLRNVNITWADTEHGQGPVGISIRNGVTICIQDFNLSIHADPLRKNALKNGYRSCIALPLKDEKACTFGAINIFSTEPNAFTEDEIRLLEKLAGDMSFGINVLRTRIERKLSDKALRESEEHIRRITDNARDIIYRMSVPDGRYEYVSPAAAEITGYEPEEWYANPNLIRKMIHPKWHRYFNEQWSTLCDGNIPPFYEYQIVHKSGDVRWINQRNVLIKNQEGIPIAIEGIGTDITERKRSEEEIKHLKNYLVNIIDSMPSILIGFDRESNITQWNRQAEKATGISIADAIGKPVTRLIPEFSSFITAMQSEIDNRRPVSLEKILIEREGERRFFDLMLYPLITNTMEGAVLRIEDITDRTRIQELMIQTEKMISLGGLAAGMAHEINNPLGIITQAAQNIERRILSEQPANLKAAEELGVNIKEIKAYFEKRRIPDFIASIQEASLRTSNIITNMLRFSSSAGRIMQSLSLGNVIEQALGLAASDYDLKKKYDFKSIEIIREYESDMPKVPLVSVEIEQVMLNLFKNSAQAMIANPPERKPVITIRLRREERYALIEVEDNGPGIEENIRRRVFEPFFTTKEPGIGTGLGLSVSYMIVTQNHKGLIEVGSTPGKGACFKLRLPLSKENLYG
jgi:PAS domain S-box-containing protein